MEQPTQSGTITAKQLREQYASLYRLSPASFKAATRKALAIMVQKGEAKQPPKSATTERRKPSGRPPQPKEAAAQPKEPKPRRTDYQPYSPQAARDVCKAAGYPKEAAEAFIDFVERKPARGRGQWKKRLCSFVWRYKKSGKFACMNFWG